MRCQVAVLLCVLYTICEASPFLPRPFSKTTDTVDDWRINGGVDADLHEFPYQAALTNTLGRLVCGASLINERYVLTAGHCLDRAIAENILVRLGEHDRSTDDETEHVVIQADRIVTHPQFNMATTFNDLGLIRLSTPVKFTKNINRVCLSTTEFTGPTAIVSGWGATNIKGETVNKLQKLELQVLSYDQCNTKLGGYRIFLTKEKICGWQPYKDSCKGDSGGPLVTVESGDNRQLVGVVSMGFQCGVTNMPGLYTRVSSYIDWIKKETADATETCYA